MVSEFLDKNNLHHAYLIEGNREKILPELLLYLKNIGIETIGSPDFCSITVDSFKIDDARNLRSFGGEKSFSNNKRIFIISTNIFLLEAQNTLLKIFEEPIKNTIFFVIIPDISTLLKTLVSRFYLIRDKFNLENEIREAEKFIVLPLNKRIDFIKELLIETEEIEGQMILDSVRSRSLNFLNALEVILYNKIVNTKDYPSYFNQIFKAREFLRQPGSSAKTLMESIALIVPFF